MKNHYFSSRLRKMLKPMATLFLLLGLIFTLNAQTLSVNKISAPAVVSSAIAYTPGTIVGTLVSLTDKGGSTCPNVSYEWQSSTDALFQGNISTNLATTKDFNPGKVSQTTYFRRIATVSCFSPQISASSTTPPIKITIH